MTFWNQGLTGKHRDIAAEKRSPIHVLAGPGTGKTFAMMRRIARLIEEGSAPEKILAVTFTRTAARDLDEQLLNLGITGCETVKVCTLHAFCFSILSKQAVFEVTGRTPRPVLSYEEKALIDDLSAQFKGRRKVGESLQAYEAAWARLQTETPGGPSTEIDIAFHTALVDWLRYHRSMLIGELVPLTLNFLQQNPQIEAFPAFDHVLVDEYQDLNKADQTLVKLLSRTGSLTVIGDDNQSIYMFRYANPEGIRLFPNENTGTVTYCIDICRRCPPNIVEISNALISNDTRRSQSIPLSPDNAKLPAAIYIVQHQDVQTEVTSCADFVVFYLNQHAGLPPGQVLVLATRRFIGNRIRDALIHRRLNSLSYFSEDALQGSEAAEGFCLLTLLVEPHDRTAIRAWISMGQQAGYAAGYRRLRMVAQEKQLELSQALDSLVNGKITLPYTDGIRNRWIQLKARLEQLSGLNGLELVRALWPPDTEASDLRLLAENIAVEITAPDAILKALRDEITQPRLPNSQSDIVRVMSLHKSKGLTASLVIVAGCVAGALPSIDPTATQVDQDLQFEEQRRLFYVAITRPTDTLVLSSSATMLANEALQNGIKIVQYRNRGIVTTAASPFMAELGSNAPTAISTRTWRSQVGF